ncbi:hypothetical protein KIL84_003983 [Mauremys mutica]|uniref:Uncharacterized protein n=1 Tax=Mauremys mutica TaxID=74926 RepID=A0A9D3WX02_9SAUR|nr:hypothetical protein KIL84_003983 [Mauremys mutica]
MHLLVFQINREARERPERNMSRLIQEAREGSAALLEEVSARRNGPWAQLATASTCSPGWPFAVCSGSTGPDCDAGCTAARAAGRAVGSLQAAASVQRAEPGLFGLSLWVPVAERPSVLL